MGEGVDAHGIEVLGCQHFGLIAIEVEGLHGLVQRVVEGCLEHTGGPHTRGQMESVHQLLRAGIGRQPNAAEKGASEEEQGAGDTDLSTVAIFFWDLPEALALIMGTYSLCLA